MFDIISALFESIVSFLQTLVQFVSFVVTNITNLFTVFNYVPAIFRGPLIMAFAVVVVLGIKKAVLA